MVENKVDPEENPPLIYVTTAPPTIERNEQRTPQQPRGEWSCSQYTLLNPARKLYCIACFHRHPDLSPATHNEEYDDDDDDDDLEEYPPFPSDNDRQITNTNNQNIIVKTMDTIASSENILEAQAEEDPFHKKMRRRMRRKHRMMVGGAAGVAVGAVLCSPTLIIAGVVGGVVGTRVVSKRKERLKDERLAKERYMMATATTPAPPPPPPGGPETAKE